MPWFLSVFKRSLLSFLRNNNFETSAALAYYGIFSLIPLLLLIAYVLGTFVLSSEMTIEEVQQLTTQILPEYNEVIFDEVFVLSQRAGIGGTLSLVALLWAVYPLAGTLRSTFFKIFRSTERRAFVWERLIDLAAVLVLLTLFVLLVISEVVYSQVAFAVQERLPFIVSITDVIAPLIITTSFIAIFYLIFSPVRLRFDYLLFGAFITALLWTVMRPAFTLFLTYNPRFGFAFGSLKAVFIILIWVYYSFAMLLLGAEIIAGMKNNKQKHLVLL